LGKQEGDESNVIKWYHNIFSLIDFDLLLRVKEELAQFTVSPFILTSDLKRNEKKSRWGKVDFYQTLDIIIPDRNLISVASEVKNK
jgi:hypothetical protein